VRHVSSQGGQKGLFSEENLIWWLLLIAALARVAALANKGVMYDRNFDDAVGYLESARILLATGRLTFYDHGLSAMVMPGFVLMIAAFMAALPSMFAAQFALKIALIVVSVATVYVVYLLGRRVGGVRVGLVAAAMLTLSMPHIYTGTIVLTENPFTLLFVAAVLFTVKLADSPGWRMFWATLACLLVAVYLRQAAAGFLLPALVYLLLRRYPRALLMKQVVVALVVGVLALSPWWVRNYRVFGAFVPFTSFDAVTLFDGTFQRIQPYSEAQGEALDDLMRGFKGSELELNRKFAAAARARVADQWSANPADVLFRYGITKPASAWLLPFYWDRVFGLSGYWILRVHALVSVSGLFGLVWLSFRSRARLEFLLMLLNVAVVTIGSMYYLGLSRYVLPYMPFLYIAIGYMAVACARLLRGRSARQTAL
jgi:4-amino-4-deoxy-L-arabinose transferase-like glycosyltransferase